MFLASNKMRTPDGPNCTIDRGNDRRIPNLCMKKTACIRALHEHQSAKNARTMKYVNRPR